MPSCSKPVAHCHPKNIKLSSLTRAFKKGAVGSKGLNQVTAQIICRWRATTVSSTLSVGSSNGMRKWKMGRRAEVHGCTFLNPAIWMQSCRCSDYWCAATMPKWNSELSVLDMKRCTEHRGCWGSIQTNIPPVLDSDVCQAALKSSIGFLVFVWKIVNLCDVSNHPFATLNLTGAWLFIRSWNKRCLK